MIRKTLVVVSAVTCVALSGYAISQSLGASGSNAPKTNLSKEEQNEQRIIKSLKLTDKQMAEYEKVGVWLKEEVAKMKQLGAGAWNRGTEINQERRARLQKIFTRAQWEQYLRMWGHGYELDEGKAVGTKAHFDKGMQEREQKILASLGLTARQRQEIEELYAQIKIETEKLEELWNGTDSKAIGRQSGKINKMQNDGMKRILTPAQWASYRHQWGADTKPQPDGKVYSPSEAVPRGSKVPPPGA